MGKTNFAPKLIKTKRNPHAHLGTNLGVWEPSNLEDQITHRMYINEMKNFMHPIGRVSLPN